MKTQILTVGIVAGFVLLANNANAQGRADFATLDTNGDGQLTLEEVQGAAETRFASVDTNGDGALSAEELTAQISENAAEKVARMIERQDENGDGTLTLEELRKPNPDRAERMFERADADGDGAISEEEFEAVKNARQGRGGKNGRGHGRGRG